MDDPIDRASEIDAFIDSLFSTSSTDHFNVMGNQVQEHPQLNTFPVWSDIAAPVIESLEDTPFGMNCGIRLNTVATQDFAQNAFPLDDGDGSRFTELDSSEQPPAESSCAPSSSLKKRFAHLNIYLISELVEHSRRGKLDPIFTAVWELCVVNNVDAGDKRYISSHLE